MKKEENTKKAKTEIEYLKEMLEEGLMGTDQIDNLSQALEFRLNKTNEALLYSSLSDKALDISSFLNLELEEINEKLSNKLFTSTELLFILIELLQTG